MGIGYGSGSMEDVGSGFGPEAGVWPQALGPWRASGKIIIKYDDRDCPRVSCLS